MKLQKINKSKKAIVLPETLKLIIGVLCIVLLLYLAVKMYDIFTKKSDLEVAKAELEDINGKIGVLADGQDTSYMLIGPKKWGLILFVQDSQKFICMCPDPAANIKDFKSCKDSGVCKQHNYNLNLVTAATRPEDNFVNLANVPREIYLSNRSGVITISTQLESAAQTTLLQSFLDSKIEVTVNGVKKSINISEQMIEVVEGRSGEPITPSAKAFFDKTFGDSWSLCYSKEGPDYDWESGGRCGQYGGPFTANPLTSVEIKITYKSGVLKVRFYELRK